MSHSVFQASAGPRMEAKTSAKLWGFGFPVHAKVGRSKTPKKVRAGWTKRCAAIHEIGDYKSNEWRRFSSAGARRKFLKSITDPTERKTLAGIRARCEVMKNERKRKRTASKSKPRSASRSASKKKTKKKKSTKKSKSRVHIRKGGYLGGGRGPSILTDLD